MERTASQSIKICLYHLLHISAIFKSLYSVDDEEKVDEEGIEGREEVAEDSTIDDCDRVVEEHQLIIVPEQIPSSVEVVI